MGKLLTKMAKLYAEGYALGLRGEISDLADEIRAEQERVKREKIENPKIGEWEK